MTKYTVVCKMTSEWNNLSTFLQRFPSSCGPTEAQPGVGADAIVVGDSRYAAQRSYRRYPGGGTERNPGPGRLAHRQR